MTQRYFRLAINIMPDTTVKIVESGSSTTTTGISDTQPGNKITFTGSDLRLSVDIGDTITPADCLGFFGLSSSLAGGTINVKHSDSDPAYADFTSFSYEQDIPKDSDRVFFPLDTEGYRGINAYARYMLIMITPPSGYSSGYLGEVAVGLAETPTFNHRWGSTVARIGSTIEHISIGGTRWAYETNKIFQHTHSLSWADRALTEQDRWQVRDWWERCNRGLYPVLLVPNDQAVNECYLSTMPTDISIIEDFCGQFSTTLEFRELIAYEEP